MVMKRVMAMGLAIIFMCSSSFAVPINITDMPRGWSEPAVLEAIDRGILLDDNGFIRPMEHLTRAEMALGINNMFGATEKADISGYYDVEKDKWYYEEMQKAVKMGTFSGYGNGLLKPEENISRQEMFSVLYNALEMEDGDASCLNRFRDRNLVGDWAVGRVASMVQNNYVAGNADGRLNPTGNMSREEFAQVMKNIFKGYYNKPGTYTDIPQGNVIINTRGVTLKNGTVTGDLVIADGVGDGEVILDNVTVMGRTIVRGGGENSIKLLNGSNLRGKVVVNSYIGKVRLYNSNSTVNDVSVKSEVILDGDFGRVNVEKPIEIETKGKIQEVVVEAKSKIKVSKGTIQNVEVRDGADEAYIYGSGKVKNVDVKANDVSIKTDGTKVTAADNVTGVKAGNKTVKPGSTSTVKKSSGGSSSSKGNSSSSSGNLSGNGTGSTSDNDKMPTFSLENGNIILGKNWSKYEVAYSNDVSDFEKNDVWKNLSTKDQDWYRGISPIFTEYNNNGVVHVYRVYGDERNESEPTYFAIRDKENTKLKQIIQVREIAQVEELKDENGKHIGVKVGDDFENYKYDIEYSTGEFFINNRFEDKEFYNSVLVLPYEAELSIYKEGEDERLDSARIRINYVPEDKVISVPDFKVDVVAGVIDLGLEHGKYQYALSSSQTPQIWYNATNKQFIDSIEIVGSYAKFVIVAEKDNLENKQVIDVASYQPESIYSKVDFDEEKLDINIDDDYSKYEYYIEDDDDTIYWYTFESNSESFCEGDKVVIRKKATQDKFASGMVEFDILPKFKFDVSGVIDLGEKYGDYMVSYRTVNGNTMWYTPANRYLLDGKGGEKGWTDDTTIVKIAHKDNLDVFDAVRIRHSTPDFEIDMLNGKLIIEDFEEVKSDYEYIQKGFFEFDEYRDVKYEDDIKIDRTSFSQILYIREKGTNKLLPSVAMAVERISGIVEDVSEVKELNGDKYREITLKVFDLEDDGKFDTRVIDIYYDDSDDTYLLADGSFGKTLLDDDFGIAKGDAIVAYDVGYKYDYSYDGFYSEGIKISNVMLIQKAVPEFSISNGIIDFGEEFSKYKYHDRIKWYSNPTPVITRNVEVDKVVRESSNYFVIFTEGNVVADAIEIRTLDDYPECTISKETRTVTLPEKVNLYDYEYKIDDEEWISCTSNVISVPNDAHEVFVRLKVGSLGNGVPGKSFYWYFEYFEYFPDKDGITDAYLLESVYDVAELEIMPYFEDDTFRPNETVTRAQMAMIVGKMIGISEDTADECRNVASRFTDVPTDDWYTGWVSILDTSGMLVGFPEENIFKPHESVTLNEVITLVMNALGRGDYLEQNGEWPSNYVTEATKLGLLENVDDSNANRGNVAMIVHNALDIPVWVVDSESIDGEVTYEEGDTLRELHFTEVDITDEAINDVTNLGIMDYYEDGEFHEYTKLTRSQMAVIVAKMRGISETTANENQNVASRFTDVPAGEWYTGWINLLDNDGMLVGFPEEDVFRPNDEVTTKEVLTFMINALGRGGYVTKMGTWPANYITEAARLNLLKGANVANRCTREKIAIFVHNTLDVPTWYISSEGSDGEEVLDENKTLRELYFTEKDEESEVTEELGEKVVL